MFGAAARRCQSPVEKGSFAAIFEQHVPLVEAGANERGDDVIEAPDVFAWPLALRGKLDRREVCHAEPRAAEPLGVGRDHDRPARRGEADDVEKVGARREGPAEERREVLWRDVALALDLPPLPVPPGRIVKERRATFRATPALSGEASRVFCRAVMGAGMGYMLLTAAL